MTTVAKHVARKPGWPRRALHALLACSCVAVFSPPVAAQQSGRTVVTAAGPQYQAGALHRLVMGRHYRSLWTTPVEVDVLDLSTFAGGLTPLRVGGGRQTKSLRFSGADGREYSFRSVDKDPSALIDSILRGTVVGDLVQDGISAAHPYGALVAAPLLDAAGVLHVDPVLRVMPDDPALGEFRAEFAGMLGLIEERPDENDDRAPFQGTVRVIGHERLTERTDESPADRVDARAYLTARVVDLFLGDWDRHRRQWRWATFEDDDDPQRSWLPVPADRDQAFSKFDGLVPRILSLYNFQLVRFESDYPAVDRLHWNGRALDRQFLAGLERPVWDSIAAAVQARLTDDVIEEAVGRLPPEIFAINGEELIGALKVRRDNLADPVQSLYELLAKEVDLHATAVREVVVVDRTDPDFVTVSLADAEAPNAPYLRRRFDGSETDEIRIYTKRRDDRVSIRGDGGGGITIRVIGGPGDDAFEVNDSRDGVHLYDSQGDNTVSGSDAPGIDTRDFEEWVWTEEDRDQPRDWGNRTFPIFWTTYSSDLGIFIGAGFRREGYGFRKSPFSSGIDLRGGYSPTEQKGRAEIDGHFNWENSSLFTTFRLRYSGLDVRRFFGFGNSTPLILREAFHKLDQQVASAEAAIGVSVSSGLTASVGLVASWTTTSEDVGQFFTTQRSSLYGAVDFWQAGATASLVYDAPVDPDATANRFRLDLRGATYPAILDVTETFTKVEAGISAVLAPSASSWASLAVRAGGQKIWGAFPWSDAAYLGGSETIRGWADQRFAGDEAVFGSAELRLRVFGSPRIIVPVETGIFGFADTGRVYLDGSSTGGWHTSFGGGLWFKPLAQPYMFRAAIAWPRTATSPGGGDEGPKIYISLGLPY